MERKVGGKSGKRPSGKRPSELFGTWSLKIDRPIFRYKITFEKRFKVSRLTNL